MTSLRAASPSGESELPRDTLERCQAHDPVAFRSFVVRYQNMVFAIISRIAGPGADVQDLAQESFLRAYRAFPSFDLAGPARVSTWLLTIAVRLAINARKQRMRTVVALPLAHACNVSNSATPETERARRELGRAIERAVAELSDDQRAAFVLSEFHGVSLADIGAVLETPESTIKTRLFRARAHLRERLTAFNKEGEIR